MQIITERLCHCCCVLGACRLFYVVLRLWFKLGFVYYCVTLCHVGGSVHVDFLIPHVLWCHFPALFGSSSVCFPLSGVIHGLAVDWIGLLLNLSLLAWDSKLCFGCDSWRV